MNQLEPDKLALARTAAILYKRLGIKSVSMDDIARELGVSKKTLYQLVANKQELIALVMTVEFEDDKRRFAEHHDRANDAIDEFLRNSRYFIREMRDIAPAMVRDLQKYYPTIWRETFQAHHAEFRRKLSDNIARGMEEGLYRSGIDAEVVSILYSGMMGMVIDKQVFPAEERSLAGVIRHMTEYHFNGIVNQFGRERLEKYLDQEALE